MLGEQIGREQGRVTVRRVLKGDDHRYIKLETTVQTEVTLFGVKGASTATYVAFERVPGQVYAEGQGIIMLETGEGAIWNGHGVGTPTGEGMGMKFAASVAFQAPTTGPLARLNNVLVAVEHISNADDTVSSTFHEWMA